MVPKKEFLEHVKGGYKSRSDILTQFTLDYPRMKLMIDGVVMTNSVDDVLLHIWNIVGKNATMYYDFLACCTQSVLVYPLERLNRCFSVYTLIDSGNSMVVMIKTTHTISFFIYKQMNMKLSTKITDEKANMMIINVQVKFNLDDDKCVQINYEKNNSI